VRLIDYPPIPGDPDAMEQTAGRIERFAADLEPKVTRLGRKVEDMRFMAPFGEQTKSDVRAMTREARAQVAILYSLASGIRARAREVRAAQARREATIRRIREADMEAARQARRSRG
jgi:hypothetical protein